MEIQKVLIWARIKKVSGFVTVFPGGYRTLCQALIFLNVPLSDNQVGHDKDGHGNLDIDFSGGLNIY